MSSSVTKSQKKNFKLEEPKSWARLQQQLHQQIVANIKGSSANPINLALYKHSAITPVLRRLAYDQDLNGLHVHSIFGDNSQPSSFPCGQLVEHDSIDTTISDEQDGRIFNLGLMSLRHPEMDYLVDFYVLRNRDIVEQESSADAEELAFQEATKLLTDPMLDEGALLNVFHTGLEPVVIGFYRAVVAALVWRRQKNKNRPLVIQPLMYCGHDESKMFNPKSPGANPDNYIQSKCWW